MSKVTMWRSSWRCVIKPAYSFSFLLSINIFVRQNVLYFLDAPRITETECLLRGTDWIFLYIYIYTVWVNLSLRSVPLLKGGGSGSIPGKWKWDLWWTKWQWKMFCSEARSFSPLSIFCQWSTLTFIHISCYQKDKRTNPGNLPNSNNL